MKRSTSILALAGAVAGFGTMAAAQTGGDVICRDFLLMDDRQQGNIVLELVQTEDGIATTSDIEGDYAIGQVDGLITACEANPQMTTQEIAAQVLGNQSGDGRELQTPLAPDATNPDAAATGAMPDEGSDAVTGMSNSGGPAAEGDTSATATGDGTSSGTATPDTSGEADATTGSDAATSDTGVDTGASDASGAGDTGASSDADAGESGAGDSGSDGGSGDSDGGSDGGSDSGGGSDGGDGGSDGGDGGGDNG